MLAQFIKENEQWLMERILKYAREQGYTEYTSTLLEAWRVSIVGMSDAIVKVLELQGEKLLEFGPEDQFGDNPFAEFGIKEARLHRNRGISLQMFLGLYKYYRYSFVDLVRTMDVPHEKMVHYEQYVERVFDLIEIAFSSEWSGLGADNQILSLQQSNREMTNEKNKYLTLFESLSFPAYLINQDGVIDNLNQPATALIGTKYGPGGLYYGPDEDVNEIRSRKLTSFFPWLKESLTDFLGGEERARHFEEVFKEGELYVYKKVSFARMRDVSGKFEGGIVTIEDVTDRKRVELQLAQAQKLESIGVLASGIAHEINTPIQFIGHNLEFLGSASEEFAGDAQSSSAKELSADMLSAVNESKDGVERVRTIVQALKRFAYPNHQDEMRIDVAEIIENVVEITRNEWKYCADVTIDCAADGVCVKGIPGDIGQILLNLLMNAIQAIRTKDSDGKERILISAARNGNDVVIAVKDSGSGIPMDNQHRIFDPFFTTKEPGEGTGQGLHIVHTLVSKHQGSVSVTSSEGNGAAFLVRLPACVSSEEGVIEE